MGSVKTIEHDKEVSKAPLAVEIPACDRRTLDSHSSTPRGLSISPKSPSQSFDDSNPRLIPSDFYRPFEPSQNNDGISAWSASSDKQLIGSPGSDRVFPIRSVVSVDPSQTPATHGARSSNEFHEGYFPAGSTAFDIASGYNATQHRHPQSFYEDDSKHRSRATVTNGRRQSGDRPRSRSARKSSVNSWGDSERYGGGRRMQIFSDNNSEISSNKAESTLNASNTQNTGSVSSRPPAEAENVSGLVTARFKHIVTAQGHAVITGRDGETLQCCEDEP